MEYSLYIVVISVFLPGSSSYEVVPTAVKGFVGGSAVLSCSIPECETPINAHLRDDEGKNVFDMIGGNGSDEHQASKYKKRVETLPEENKKCNFSIKLNALQKSDEREYICYITGPYQIHTKIKLQVEDKPVGSENHGQQRGEHWRTLTVSLLISFSLPVILRLLNA